MLGKRNTTAKSVEPTFVRPIVLPRFCFLLLLPCWTFDLFSARGQEQIEVSEALVTVIDQVRVPALRAGQVTTLNVAEGDRVRAGQLLAQIDDRVPRLAKSKAESQLRAALQAARSELTIRLAIKKHELAKSDLRRAEQARSRLAGSIPDEEYENRKLLVERAALEIEKCKEDRENALADARLFEDDYRTAELDQKLTRIESPIAGVVVSIERNEGEWASAGETVLEILGTSRLRAEAMIEFARISQPLFGKPVRLEVDLPDGSSQEFEGRIRFESPEINPLDNRVSVWAEIANPRRRLRPGMRGRMTIDLAGNTSGRPQQKGSPTTGSPTKTDLAPNPQPPAVGAIGSP
jgi:multidrug efflux pump subunit AcrA (membrane-fusion protein)